jgi:uncharacterized protein (DUF2141 family)
MLATARNPKTMKKSLASALATFLLLASFVLKAQGQITVAVSNFRSNRGLCRACLFRDAASFLGKGAPVQCQSAMVRNRTALVTFANIPRGTYAIAVFHDENSNGQMDKKIFGIPAEGYGASGNRLPFASAPSFEDNQFFLENNSQVRLSVRLRNL